MDGGVIKSDDSVNSSTKKALVEAVIALERDGSRHNSDDTTVDVVDPFLFAFSFNKTRTLRRGTVTLQECIARSGQGETVKMPSADDCVQKDQAKYPNDMAWSRHYQWLPFEVTFEKRGDGASRRGHNS